MLLRIIGFNFSVIQAKREKTLAEEYTADTNIEIESITENKSTTLSNQTTLAVNFSFKVSYKVKESKNESNTKVKIKQKKAEYSESEIILKGTTLISCNSQQASEILSFWKKKALPDNLKYPLYNILITRCSVKALQLEEELNLPLHLPLPRVTPKAPSSSPPQSQPDQKQKPKYTN